MPKAELKPDLHRRLISTERMMVAHVYLEEGCIVPKHSHENEQLTYILEGTLRFWLGEDESEVVDVHAGEVLHIPSWLSAPGTGAREDARHGHLLPPAPGLARRNGRVSPRGRGDGRRTPRLADPPDSHDPCCGRMAACISRSRTGSSRWR